MLGLRGDITSGASPFMGTGLTGLDTTGTVCSWASWLFIEQMGDLDIFSQLKQGFILDGIAIGGRSTGEMRFFVADAAAQTNCQSAAGYLKRGVWAHYGVTWDGARVRFYRNGALHSTAAQSGTPTATGTRTTSGSGFNTGNPPGRYFDTRWFPNTLLTPAGVKASMDPRRTIAGCKGRWFRNMGLSGVSVKIADESGNGNDLTTSANPARSQMCAPPPPTWRRLKRYIGFVTSTTATKLGVQTQPAPAYLSEVALGQLPAFLVQDAGGATVTGSSAIVTITPASPTAKFNLPYTSPEPIATTHTIQAGSTTTALIVSPPLSFPTLTMGSSDYTGKRYVLRFTVGTTTVALRDVHRVIASNTGTTQLNLATALGTVPAAGDTIEVHSGFEATALSVAAVAGVATFPAFSISGNANTALVASSAGLTGITTNSITNLGTYYRGAELPRATVDTTYPSAIGAQYTVGSGKTYTTVQSAYNAAVVANLSTAIELLIDPGTYPEHIQLKAKTNPGEIIFRKAVSHVAPAGTRVRPFDFFTGQVKIAVEDTQGVVRCDAGACYVRFCGIEIAQPIPAGGTATDLLSVMYLTGPDGGDGTDIAQYPHHIIVDRCYVHGGTGIEVRKGIVIGGPTMAVVDSDVRDIFNLTAAAGGIHWSGDTNAVATYYSPGPLKVDNCYLNSAGEIFLTGGADTPMVGMVPSDIMFTRNHLYKPLSWKGTYQAKNNLELKNTRRMLIEGNIFDGSWLDAQDGTGILFSSVNQGEHPERAWHGNRDIVFRKNAVRNMTAAFTLTVANTWYAYPQRRLVVENIAAWNINGVETYSGGNINRLMLVGGGIDSLIIDHVLLLAKPGNHTTGIYFSDPGNPHSDVTNSIFTADQYGVLDTLANSGTAAITAQLPDGTFAKNALIDRVGDGVPYPPASWYPPTNADVGFTTLGITSTWDVADPDAVCAALTLTGASLYHAGNARQSTDAKDVGPDMTALRAAIAGVLTGTGGSGGVADHLSVATQPSTPIVSGTAHVIQPVVAVRDITNATVTSDTSTVTAALVVETGIATPIGLLTKAAVAGAADFAANGLGATSLLGATAHWHFTDGALIAVDSVTFTITAAAAALSYAASPTRVIPPSFAIKQGDTAPPLVRALRGADGAPQDLTGATVRFSMRLLNGPVIISRASCTIVDAPNGSVKYSWQAADTALKGTCLGEFEVTLSDGSIITFPDDGYHVVTITPQIA